TSEKRRLICKVCDEITSGKLENEFPLSVWQTGSGTHTNMNLNEVIANRGNFSAGKKMLHPNDDVNMSQSSNDTFPTAMHIAAAYAVKFSLIPAVNGLIKTFKKLEIRNTNVIMTGRTHLRDAVPVSFAQQIKGWRGSLERAVKNIGSSLPGLCSLAIGATAVGTGLNAPPEFGKKTAAILRERLGLPFVSAENKFTALTSLGDIAFAHGALKALAADLMKIANDIRWLSSGPRCGIGEITVPANEPGSSIMPGKVNPTQCEAVTMVAVQVAGNDASIGFAASQGNFQLNVFLPVVAYNFLQSARLLADAVKSFDERCVRGIKPDKDVIKRNLERSLMLVTALTPAVGYDKAAEIAKKAHEENITLKEACVAMGVMTAEEFDKAVKPENMV
ncbi:MAG: class II fumarate hydratase, partial [Clostridia bacterium]|nr:class II fumarate hydratase [Clostridia bacterium]